MDPLRVAYDHARLFPDEQRPVKQRADASPPVEPAPTDPMLSIGVFARRSRLSMKALRLYERLGLLTPAHVDPSNGYRQYRESQLATARLVAMLRRLEMPLAQVAEVVSAAGPQAAELVAATGRRSSDAPPPIASWPHTCASGSWVKERSYGMFDVRERDVPEQLVLTEQRHLRVGELSRLAAADDRSPGRSGATALRRGVCAVFVDLPRRGQSGQRRASRSVCADRRLTARRRQMHRRARELAHREAYVQDHQGAGRVPADPVRV